jgi:hypothetical protein
MGAFFFSNLKSVRSTEIARDWADTESILGAKPVVAHVNAPHRELTAPDPSASNPLA